MPRDDETLDSANRPPGDGNRPAGDDNRESTVGDATQLHASAAEGPIDPTTAQDPPAKLDSQIGPYRLLEPLGEGGMGTVYLAEQREPIQRRVALKIIKSGMDTNQVIARFEAERQALAMMEHPNIAKVLDAGTTDTGQPYFVMELVNGHPISDFCDNHKLGIPQRLELFAKVCSAVQHAHQKDIIHRDLKPTNILVELRDDQPVVKVIDFGLAKATNQRLTEKTMFTAQGQVLGTPEYMSPEQARLNDLDIDTRSDVYSLGVILYELLTGSTPLNRESLREAGFMEILKRIQEEEPERPSSRICESDESLASISAERQIEPRRFSLLMKGDLDWIVLKAIEKDRSRRYETANGLAADIQRFLSDEPIIARPPSAIYRIQKFTRKHRAAVTTMVAFAGLLIVASVVSGVLAVKASRAEALANTRFEGEKEARKAEEKQRELAEESAARSEKILAIVGDSFDAPNPDSGATADMSANDVLLKAKESLDSSDLDDLGKIHLLARLYHSFTGLSQYDEAVEVTEEWRDLSTATFGPDHPDTLSALSNLANGYRYAGRTKEAIALEENTLQTKKSKLGPKHPGTLYSMSNLAAIYFDAGRIEEAVKLSERTLELKRAELGLEHKRTLSSMSNLAVFYQAAGLTEKAVQLAEQSFQLKKAKLGEDHPDTLSSMSALAVCYRAAGRAEDSLKLKERTLELKTAKLGPDHASTLDSMGNLAASYRRAGRIEEAIKLNLESLRLRTDTLGPKHPDTLYSMNSLAASYGDAGRVEEAIKLHEKTFELRKTILGADHPQTLVSMGSLAASYSMSGRIEEGIESFVVAWHI